MNKKIYIIILLLIIIGAGAFFYLNNKQVVLDNNIDSEEIVGGDRDEHGCIPSAGYSWCEVKNKCLRIWEEPCQVENDNPDDINENEKIEEDKKINLTQTSCEAINGVWFIYNQTCEVNHLSEGDCRSLGGEFNECNSACRHNPEAEVCTMQCVITCTLK